MLILHIIIALTSLALAAAAYLLPTKLKLKLSQAMIALTIGSGTYLVFTMQVNLLRVCMMGLFYLAIASAATALGYKKMAAQEALQRRL